MQLPEQYRVTPEFRKRHRDLNLPRHLATAESSPYGGLFLLPQKAGLTDTFFRVVATCKPGSEWEHVSVTLLKNPLKRYPSWEEMCYIKAVFFGDDVTVVRYQPDQADYVKRRPHSMHLWRRSSAQLPRAPKLLVD